MNKLVMHREIMEQVYKSTTLKDPSCSTPAHFILIKKTLYNIIDNIIYK